MENITYSLNQIMTIVEAAERYGINEDSLRNKFKPRVTKPERIKAWIESGLVRQSGSTWLLTETFIRQNYAHKMI